MAKHENSFTVPVCTLSTQHEVFGRPGQVSTMFTILLAYVE
jgi:hypothetical protein